MSQSDPRIEYCVSGLTRPTKGSFPVRYGRSIKITTSNVVIELDVSGRIKYLRGQNPGWSDPQEYLKRTDANDWVYYSLGEYADYFGIYGEYYLPCPTYETNRPLGGEPFRRAEVRRVIDDWWPLLHELYLRRSEFDADSLPVLEKLYRNNPHRLAANSRELHHILGTSIPSLPPDARHVDYDVIPLIVADGCRYGCRFCRLQDGQHLRARSRTHIREQLQRLRSWLGSRIGEYQGLFLGLHDALAVDEDLLHWALEQAYQDLGYAHSRFSRPLLFLFGSVASLLEKPLPFFERLDRGPWSSYINVGLEAADDQTLVDLGKPISAEEVKHGLRQLLEINSRCPNTEVTANFILFPDEGRAEQSMLELMHDEVPGKLLRGVCYLSMLMSGSRRPRAQRRPLIQRIHRLQREAPLPLLLYLIQRL